MNTEMLKLLNGIKETDPLLSSILDNRTYSINRIIKNNNNHNLSLENITKHAGNFDWGPKRDPLYIVIPITVIYAIIFLTGIIGNLSTCIVIFRNKSMHTATNYYLFSLAISDLLLLISGLPQDIYLTWSKYPYIFGEEFCVMQGFAAETSTNATVLTITAFTIERYVAICHPFLSHTLSKLSRAIKFVIAIWIIAMLLAIPQAMSMGIYYEKLKGRTVKDHCVCTKISNNIPHAFVISTCLFFVAPMSLITILYILIGLQLHKSTVGPSRGGSVRLKHRVYKPMVAYTHTSTQAVLVVKGGDDTENVQLARQEEDGRKNFARNAQATKHVVKMLIAVVVAFFICWAPFHAQRLLAIYGRTTSYETITAYKVLTYVSGVLYYLSTTVNPLLYHIMSHKFREAFKDTFHRFFMRGRRPTGNKCYNTLSARSSQINSHSNTDSCSRQSSLRYLEAEMARLHDSRRPLVVSFRRKKTQIIRSPKQVTILDSDLQNALNNLKNEPLRQTHDRDDDDDDENDAVINNRNDCDEYEIPVYKTSSNLPGDCSFIELHSLQPRHICPVNGSKLPFLLSTYHGKVDEIEMLKGQHFKLNRTKRSRRHRDSNCSGYSRKSMQKDAYQLTVPDRTFLTKSCTMPHMVSECANNTMQKYKCTGNSLSLTASNLSVSNCKHNEQPYEYDRIKRYDLAGRFNPAEHQSNCKCEMLS